MDRSVERLNLITRLVSDGPDHTGQHFATMFAFGIENYPGRLASDGAHPKGLSIKRRVASPSHFAGSDFTRFADYQIQDPWQKLFASFVGFPFGNSTEHFTGRFGFFCDHVCVMFDAMRHGFCSVRYGV
jgi:hypothetical protein